jgi:hypothetical protein
MAWVWGPLESESTGWGSVAETFHDNGLIDLYLLDDKSLYIAYVVRPPGDLYPARSPFCSTLLPIAVKEFISRTGLVESLKSVEVELEAGPYLIFACKCYVRLMLSMQVSLINGREPPSPEGVQDYCKSVEHLLGTFDGPVRLPPIDQRYQAALNTASFRIFNDEIIELSGASN